MLLPLGSPAIAGASTPATASDRNTRVQRDKAVHGMCTGALLRRPHIACCVCRLPRTCVGQGHVFCATRRFSGQLSALFPCPKGALPNRRAGKGGHDREAKISPDFRAQEGCSVYDATSSPSSPRGGGGGLKGVRTQQLWNDRDVALVI